MTAKEYYKSYQADVTISELNGKMIDLILKESPVHVFEFGCGSGKNLNQLHRWEVVTIGLDISFLNIIKAKSKYELPCVICADESYLRNICNCDIVFTISVLDHIEDIDGIIGEFKRIANKAIFLAETNDIVGEFYFDHDYQSYGFEKLDFEYTGEDGAKYFIWKWIKESDLVTAEEVKKWIEKMNPWRDEAFNILSK